MSNHPYDSILWHDYGNHKHGGHIKFLSKSKYLATDLIQITHCQHFILPIQVFASDHLSMFVEHCFYHYLMLAFKYQNCRFKYQVAGFYKIHNTLSEHKKFVMIITEATEIKFVKTEICIYCSTT